LPTFTLSDGREDPTAPDESSGGRREDPASALKRLEDSLLNLSSRFGRPCAHCQLLHHDGAQVSERKRSLQKYKNIRLSLLISEAIDEDVCVERVLHTLRRPSTTFSTPPLRRTAANPFASSSRNATKSRAWSMASVSVSTPNARRATSSFR